VATSVTWWRPGRVGVKVSRHGSRVEPFSIFPLDSDSQKEETSPYNLAW
jgi:hypothetical protein